MKRRDGLIDHVNVALRPITVNLYYVDAFPASYACTCYLASLLWNVKV